MLPLDVRVKQERASIWRGKSIKDVDLKKKAPERHVNQQCYRFSVFNITVKMQRRPWSTEPSLQFVPQEPGPQQQTSMVKKHSFNFWLCKLTLCTPLPSQSAVSLYCGSAKLASQH